MPDPGSQDPGPPERLDQGLHQRQPDAMEECPPNNIDENANTATAIPDTCEATSTRNIQAFSLDPSQAHEYPTKRRFLSHVQVRRTIPQKRHMPSITQQHQSQNLATNSGPILRNHSFSSAPEHLGQMTPTILTVNQGVDQAMAALVKAAALAAGEQQHNLLDLIEIFRDYTVSGRVQKKEANILSYQITKLDLLQKSLIKSVSTQAKSAQKTPLQPQPATQQAKPAAWKPQPPQQSQNTPVPSWANTASQNIPKGNEWTEIKKKSHTPVKPKNSLSSRQLVLVQNHATPRNIPFDPFTLRNKINKAFEVNGLNLPVVVSVTCSQAGNTVLTTTPDFNAAFLIEKKHIWEEFAQFQEAIPIQPWFKVAIHGIPTATEDLDVLGSEIRIFNGLTIVGKPYWLSYESNRREKMTGSICVAFASQKDADQAIRRPFYIFGIPLKVEKAHSTPPSTQCKHCQRFGHTDTDCHHAIACKFCSAEHSTPQHSCNICNTKGRTCKHLIPKCANCTGPHMANSIDCETLLAVAAKSPRGQNNSNAPNSSM